MAHGFCPTPSARRWLPSSCRRIMRATGNSYRSICRGPGPSSTGAACSIAEPSRRPACRWPGSAARDGRTAQPSPRGHPRPPVRIAVILGTRPEAIKLVPLVRITHAKGWDVRLWWTGQHDDMVQDVPVALRGRRGRADGRLAGVQLGVPDLRLCDRPRRRAAASVGAGSRLGAGRYDDRRRRRARRVRRRYAVGHVEAGLRTYDLTAPFPEEANRQIISRVASLHYTPTGHAHRDLLVGEHVPAASICVTGNTGIDALFLGIELPRCAPDGRRARRSVAGRVARPRTHRPVDTSGGSLYLVTTHRSREPRGAPPEHPREHRQAGPRPTHQHVRVPRAPEPCRQGPRGRGARRHRQRSADPAALDTRRCAR